MMEWWTLLHKYKFKIHSKPCTKLMVKVLQLFQRLFWITEPNIMPWNDICLWLSSGTRKQIETCAKKLQLSAKCSLIWIDTHTVGLLLKVDRAFCLESDRLWVNISAVKLSLSCCVSDNECGGEWGLPYRSSIKTILSRRGCPTSWGSLSRVRISTSES